MAKLTKAEAKAHQAACDLLEKDRLTIEERIFVVENWQESAKHINSVTGAFFTPWGLALDFSVELAGRRVIDLCAGIGTLSLAYFLKCQIAGAPQIVCVEKNPDFVAVGKKVLPEATWITADIFDLQEIGRFDCAYGNPPFGATPRMSKRSARYSGSEFEYHAIGVAADIADYGVFIIPQMSAPFSYSGQPSFTKMESERYRAFVRQTGIELGPNCGIDTSVHAREWHGVSVAVEIVTSEFNVAAVDRAQADLFARAAE
ncbi:methyltransferase [Bradyrhizobium sp. SZCCHNR3015]|uniref:methyltransferase n=1 Tax=Bradyrhizobium sp. SZCCHNR3015 TaxID=3057395 RepID=UPI0029163155|nr:methyltransferase [Bradyrhizobium sp. SZCCHNR3015]